MKRGNGFGSVIKLGGKRRRPYAARVTQGWTLEGKQIIKYIGYYATKREAAKALEAYNTNPYELDVKKHPCGCFFIFIIPLRQCQIHFLTKY